MAGSNLKNLRIVSIGALLALLNAGAPLSAFADDARLSAEPSSTEITVDENLSVQFNVTTSGMVNVVSDLKYKAPDFDEVNNYASGSKTESSYINGHITMRQTKMITAVLRPRHEGHLVITGIEISVNGQLVHAPDLAIDVRASGARIGNRSSNGTGYPQANKLPNGGSHGPSQQNAGTFFIKTEPSKLKVYKGEQVILTYALYTRVQMMNIQVERYPNPNGFLKEDIDIPLLRGRLDYSPSVVNGHEFRRAALAQYAVFPLEVGTLPIDTFTAKFSFQPRVGGAENDDDPFAMINQFFRAMQTTTEMRTSDRVNLEVLPLPGAGQPANFSGLVGDFDITAVADKTSVKAGEPINVKVKVEGKGHAGSLEHLPVKWPADFELYEDKSNTQYLRSGQSERLFEYMVIPKTKGHFEIPPIELTMFNPDTHSYQTRNTQAIAVEVLEGNAANVYVPKIGPATGTVVNGEDIRYWKDGAPSANSSAMVRNVARAAAAASVLLAALGLWSLGTSPDEESRQSRQRIAQALKDRAEALKKSSAAPVEILGEVESILAQILELQFDVAIGSLLRAEVTQSLMDRARIDETTAKRVEALIELVEHQRYVPGGGDRASAVKAVDELTRLVERIYPH